MSGTTAIAAPDPAPNIQAEKAKPVDPPSVMPQKRAEVLGKDWQQSKDRLWTTMGDQTGFHVMVAEAKSGYAWKTIATLNHPAVEADLWIGNACVTGSGDRLVVVYAPRTYTNKEALMARGGFTATVDLTTGAVKKLPVRTTLAYFNPGCGLDETAVLTQDATEDKGKTGLIKLDTATGTLSKRIELDGQVTSAVPTREGIVAVAGTSVQRIADDGKRTKIAKTTGWAFELKPDADHGVVYLDGDDKTINVRRVAANADKETTATTLAAGKSGEVKTAHLLGGKVVITGRPDKVEKLPASVSRMDVPAGAQLSLRGEAVVTEVARADGGTPGVFSKTPGKAEKVHIKAKSTKTGKDVGFTVDPATAAAKPASEPAQRGMSAQSDLQATANQDMSDSAATCAIKRNDLGKQIYQPKPKQVEWAANWAVKGGLMTQRPAGWHNNGLPFDYKIQEAGMFPPVPMKNATDTVPVQVLLGILGQESNLWQASKLVLPGEYANPLIGNFYGNDIYNNTEADDWNIDFSKADCGYGVSQTTDGMRLAGRERPGERAKPWGAQVMIATDYAANVAAGLQILQEKWNQLQDAGVRINNNDVGRLENWFGAVWAYNSGFHPPGEAGSNGAYGLGWGNNPANMRYPADRHEFGRVPYDFAHPQDWPYPEKVMGFAANPPSAFEDATKEVPFFNNASWNGDDKLPDTNPDSAWYNKKRVKPEIDTFCKPDQNQCDKTKRYMPNAPEVVGEPAGPCGHTNAAGQYDLKCWWHGPAVWKPDCEQTCGNESFRYYPEVSKEPDDGISSRPECESSGLPGDALVVDDVDAVTPPAFDDTRQPHPTCRRLNLDRDGKFNIEFSKDASGKEPARMDLHQATSGYGGHFWFTHAYGDDELGRKLRMKATWELGRKLDTPVQVWVFRPKRTNPNLDPLVYTVYTANGPIQVTAPHPHESSLPTSWLDLGTFKFSDKPKVSVSNWNANANEKEIAFDAVAFVPDTGNWGGERIAKIINVNSNRCVAQSEPGASGKVYAVQKSCTNQFGDNWEFRLVRVKRAPSPGGGQTINYYTYRIVNRVSGLCMNLIAFPSVSMGGCTTDDNTTAELWETTYGFTGNENPHPRWIVSLMNSHTGGSLALGLPNCSKDENANVQVIDTYGIQDTQPGCKPQEVSLDWNIAQQGT
ncbi:hypothetical protein Lesp02_52740 [Lentzea sp. NBRC 105346]|uniref:RICIN domain-containing protein n=1 Tax=Lentzea sp. NBRC 105346 TaxID=3032205 RepID=UPI0024A008B0|nr:RICIN domain-containing protein [Lentzea sp. NBRC 105346]GLZ33086.1 hypothetical protein Lesp02_52740 [Lentzea sp. NBRC 105346]